ncbi:hypothetical protein ACR52_05415 [Pseudomonas fildesensis]|uniref:Uncharacterized protein n=1 Tax=Pseudomonas fildesensis TaxID=1674920 RepID=A0A0J8G855_9PSED|nr:hypothetical protein ACR52_05415 [Pseudomonas fildesensis]
MEWVQRTGLYLFFKLNNIKQYILKTRMMNGLIVPILRVGMPLVTLRVTLWAAERGNDKSIMFTIGE